MPTSVWRGIETFLEIVTKTRAASLLDIGVGNGKWGFLFREYTDVWNERYRKSDWTSQVDGIEIYSPYIQDHQRAVYTRILHGDASLTIDGLPAYDVVMAGDVIEHLEKEKGERLVRKLMHKSRRAFIAIIPLGQEWLRPSFNENEFEAHRSVWTLDDARALGFKYYRVFDAADGRRRVGLFVSSQENLRGVGGLEEFELSAPLRVVHLSLTPLAGSPIRIVNGLNRFSKIQARLIVLDPAGYGARTFENDLIWNCHREESLALLQDCDIIHLHHYFDLSGNQFGIDLTELERAGKRFIRQFHSTPGFLARRLYDGDLRVADEMVHSPIPQLVIPHYPERYFPRARVVPQILPLHETPYTPLEPKAEHPTIVYTPSVALSAWFSENPECRFETKGLPETCALLERLTASVKGTSYSIVQDTPHDVCLAERRRGHIAIDEMVSGSCHLCSFEALAQGLPTFAYLDPRTLRVLADLTGSADHPWMNFKLEDAEQPLKTLLLDADLRREIGAHSRAWMERHWHPRDMVQHYVRAYQDLMEHPDLFDIERYDLANRRHMWYIRDSHDLDWTTRVRANRNGRESDPNPSEEISDPQAGKWATTEQILLQATPPVCIVGNAAATHKFGSIIDSYATVIRMNNFRISGFEEFVGTKTDFRCVTGWVDVENRNEHLEFSPFTAEARESGNLARYNACNKRKVITARHDVRKYISEVPNPSAGFALVQLFDMLDIPVDLFGFDGFRTDHYWRNEKVETTHSTREIDYILKRRNILLCNDRGIPQPARQKKPNLAPDFCLKKGYRSRLRPEYFDDSCEEHDGIVWQPDVYDLAAALGTLTGCSHIIDLGCGRGQKLSRLHPGFAILGVDCGANLQHCRQAYNWGSWIEWDLELPACPPIDHETVSQSVIVCSDVIEHLLDPSHLLGYIRSWLRHSPIAVLSTPERDLTRGVGDLGPPGNPAHVREWNIDEFKDMLARAGLRSSYCGLTRSNNRDHREHTLVCIVQRKPSGPVATYAKKWLDDVREFEKRRRDHPKRIGLFGASSRGRQCLTMLAGNDLFVPACFFDNDPGKWGTLVENLPVLAPEACNLESVDVVLITSMRASEIMSQLASLGMSRRVALDVPDLLFRFSILEREAAPVLLTQR